MFRSISAGVDSPIDAVVIGLWKGASPSAAEPSEVLEAASRPEFKGDAGDLVEAFPVDFPRTIIVGLGEKAATGGFSKGMAAAARKVSAAKCRSVQIRFDELDQAENFGRTVGEVFGLLAWNSGQFKSETTDFVDLRLESDDQAVTQGISRGLGVAQGLNLARTLSWTPPNVATPMWMAEQAQALAERTELTCTVISGEQLAEEKLIGLINVGKASINPPCLIRLEWNPLGSDEAPIVLLGKTVTYDTGGLSIKGKTHMPGMKGDKAGGCAVLGAMQAIATVTKPQKRVVALLVAAENSISDQAYRPDDVITFRNGTSVEVTNTDAEGRLVLADGLCWATEVEKAAVIIDIATLTGGVVVALGKVMAGLFANDDNLAEMLYNAGEKTSERLWRLPLDEEYKALMKSGIADMVNSNLNGLAHPVQGATFLSAFVPVGTPWAHLDIAGVSNSSADSGPWVTGPTGFGTRLMVEAVEQWPVTKA